MDCQEDCSASVTVRDKLTENEILRHVGVERDLSQNSSTGIKSEPKQTSAAGLLILISVSVERIFHNEECSTCSAALD